MKTSELMQKLIESLAPTLGNRKVKELLLEQVGDVEALEKKVESLEDELLEAEVRLEH